MEIKPRFRISELALNEDNEYSVVYYGRVAEQGGFRWGMGQVTLTSLDSALTFIKCQVEENLKQYQDLIKEKIKLEGSNVKG